MFVQISAREKELEGLRQDKHKFFSELKSVLNKEDEMRKRAQEKEHNEMVASMQQAPGMTSGQHMFPSHSQMSKYMNVSSIQQQRALLAVKCLLNIP